MKKFFVLFFIICLSIAEAGAFCINSKDADQKAVERLLKKQVRFANNANYQKFMSTYDKNYTNNDGFDLDTYSKIVLENWKAVKNMKYNIQIKNITIDNDSATAELVENSYAPVSTNQSQGLFNRVQNPEEQALFKGELKSNSDTISHLKKIDGKWKVTYDNVLTETTSLLYGDATNLDIKLSAPNEINKNVEYTASLEFKSPDSTFAIASIASDLVEYPHGQAKEIYRVMPEDNILERLFTSNNKNKNECIIATIGLTKNEINNISIKLSLTGFGYVIKRVNVEKEKTSVAKKTDE